MNDIEIAAFDGFAWESDSLSLFYSWQTKNQRYDFTHKLAIPGLTVKPPAVDEWRVYAFHLGLARFPYYFAGIKPKRIVIKAGTLDPNALSTWKKWYTLGLAEFLYKNNLPLDIPLECSSSTYFTPAEKDLDRRFLLLNGGGKDSAVGAELLKSTSTPFKWFVLGMNSAQSNTISISGVQNVIRAKGKSDATRKAIKQKGQMLGGHQPLSLYLAFVAAFVAHLDKSRFIVSSNEKSANYGNLVYEGKEVNHQYTKSYEFESDFRKYSQTYLNPELEYFSILRPLYELQILKIFSKMRQYHPHFISCNNGINKGIWCGKCSKCAFIFLGLYPFMKKEDVIKIVGKNMLNDSEMLPRYLKLCGIEGTKPFECVGTTQESLSAMYLASLKPSPDFIVQYFIDNILQLAQGKDLAKSILNNYDDTNYIPTDLKAPVEAQVKKLL